MATREREKVSIPAEMWSVAQSVLETDMLLSVQEFDRIVGGYAPKQTKGQRLTGGRRTVAENLCDHVKRRLTQLNMTRRLTIGGKDYLVWVQAYGTLGLPDRGGHFLWTNDFVLFLDRLQEVMTDKPLEGKPANGHYIASED